MSKEDQEHFPIVTSIVETLSNGWEKPVEIEQPFLLLLAGLQGSGKTTLLQTLQQQYHMPIISLDEIRHQLFDRGVPFSDEFVALVEECRDALLTKVFSLDYSCAVDTNVTDARKKQIEDLMASLSKENYGVKTVYLTAPQDVLRQRVQTREKLPGVYQGKLDELEASMQKHGQPDLSLYDLVIDTSQVPPEAVTAQVQQLLETEP